MLYKETVSASTLDLLKHLMLDDNLGDFFLVGGTALSLQIGHRISIDIDLFSEKPFDENQIAEYLESHKGLMTDYLSTNTVKGQIGDVKLDLIAHSYPLLNPVVVNENIRLASLEDIAAMKLNAIIGNGTRLKDFIDIAYMSSFISFKKMIDAYEKKYSARNPLIALKAIIFHQDINFQEPLKMINGKFSWKIIEKRLVNMEKSPSTVFDKL